MSARRAILLFIATLALAGAAAAAPVTPVREEHRFMWDEANAQLAQASTPDDFRRGAERYLALYDSGVRNGPLFHNLGLAWLMAGEYEAARRALIRAERYDGASAGLRRNLALALAEGDSTLAAHSLPWTRIAFAWHFDLPLRRRTLLAGACFTLAWVAWALRRIGAGRVGGHLLWLGCAGLVLFGSSAAISLYEEAHAPSPRPPLTTPAAPPTPAATEAAP